MPSLFPPPEDRQATLEGVLERVTFTNDANGWSVVRLLVEGEKDLVTAVGSLVGVKVGEALRLTGEWVEDRRYGRQFRIASYMTMLPTTAAGIAKYIASGVLPGVGEKTAAKIVAAFGTKTLDVLTSDPDRLRDVPGLRKKWKSIAEEWKKHRAFHETMVFLQSLGLGTALAVRIVKLFGPRASEIVRSDPYRLAAEVHGIGFLTADRVAAALGIPPSAPARADAATMHALREAVEDGHCYVPRDELALMTEKLLGPEGAPAREAADRVVERRLAVLEAGGVWAMPLWEAEVLAAARLRALVDAPPVDVPIHAEKAVAWFQRESRLTLATGQTEAILAAIRGKVTVITGGPGTGKTTLVRGLTRIFGMKGLRLALCAPTGRAARRLAEAAGVPAKTIHRLLEWNPAHGAPTRGLAHPLEAQVVIVDESSMVDIFLLRQLLEAISLEARVIFVGDADQLPSVGPGSVLRDIIASGVAGTVRLTEIFRQDARSLIVSNAYAVLQGELPQPLGDDFAFLERDNPEAALATVLELATRELPRRLGLSAAEVQVLVPMHRGSLGAIALNAALQERLNPAGAPIVPQRPLRVGDKVMQVRNNYDLDVFNGDLGLIESCEGDIVSVRFYDRTVRYDADDIDQLDPAYACTIHKSQGSEYPAVVIALHQQHFPMLQRNLLYTAITRGKKFVAVVGSRRALATAVGNDRERLRWTRLAERLSGRE